MHKYLIGIRCLAAIWFLKMLCALAKAISLSFVFVGFGIKSESFAECVPKAAFAQATCQTVAAFFVFYYLMFRGKLLCRVIESKHPVGSDCKIAMLKVFTVLWGVALCVTALYVLMSSPIQVIPLYMSPYWESADTEITRELLVSFLGSISQGIASLLIGVILFRKCDMITTLILKKVPQNGEGVTAH